MNVFEQAIMQAANSTFPGSEGWRTLQDWKTAILDNILRREPDRLERPRSRQV